MICPKCHGEGKLVSEEWKPVTMTTGGWVKKEEVCNVCSGTGQVQDDLTGVIERLDQIIKILKEGGKSRG